MTALLGHFSLLFYFSIYLPIYFFKSIYLSIHSFILSYKYVYKYVYIIYIFNCIVFFFLDWDFTSEAKSLKIALSEIATRAKKIQVYIVLLNTNTYSIWFWLSFAYSECTIRKIRARIFYYF